MAATNTKENEENLQIFLKIKPLTEAELAKQSNE
jgi:hypothetical protein